MRLRPFAQLLVMHQRLFRAQSDRLAVAEGPFAAVAVFGADIAVDVETAQMGGGVGARGMDQIRAPQGDVAGFQDQVEVAAAFDRIFSTNSSVKGPDCYCKNRR